MSALFSAIFLRCQGLFGAVLWLAVCNPAVAAVAFAQAPADGVEAATAVDSRQILDAEVLWGLLQAPGDALYAVLLRHALAPGVGDPANFTLGDCSTQRNLSAEGRAQARQIGEGFRQRNVVVGELLSSQWCRCRETAELMSIGEVKPFPLLNSFFRERSKAGSQTAGVKQYLLSRYDDPGVVVMVTHQVNITALTGIVPRSGEAVVLKLDSSGMVKVGELSFAP